MISITNVSKVDLGLKPNAVCTYEIRIGNKFIARFRHRRGQGLAVCLRKASQAVELADSLVIEELLAAVDLAAPSIEDGNGNGKRSRRSTVTPRRRVSTAKG